MRVKGGVVLIVAAVRAVLSSYPDE